LQTKQIKNLLLNFIKLIKIFLHLHFFVGNTLTVIDVFFFVVFHPIIKDWKENERIDFINITRWFDFTQHQDLFSSSTKFPLIEINKNVIIQPKPSKEKKDNKKDSTVEVSKDTKQQIKDEEKKEQPKVENKEKPKEEAKSEKRQAPVKAVEVEKPIDISRLNIRVGKIVDVKKHEAADSLYIEQIDVGEDKPRQVVSGLVKFIPIEEMKNREVLILCNLKPANLKGIRSEAMVLAASNDDHTKVELVDPPKGSKIGERVTFDGYPGEPDTQLNPKHKIWETVQPDLKSNGDLIATWKGVAMKTGSGICTVKSIANGGIK